MKYLVLLIFSFCLSNLNAQILGTTSAGRQVVLNMDGTWKYADGSNPVADCLTNGTGTLNVTNATNNDIYFYYTIEGKSYESPKSLQIKAHSSRIIDNMFTTWPLGNGGGKFVYKWVASLEFYGTGKEFSWIKGFENNDFMLTNCQTYNLRIGN